MGGRRWSNKEILNALKTLNRKYGDFKIHRIDKFRRAGLICDRTVIRRRFGSIENAGELADIKFNKEYKKKWTKNNIILSFLKIYKKKKNRIVKNELRKLYRIEKFCTEETVLYHFGSLDNFAKEANIIFTSSTWHRSKGRTEKIVLDYIEKKKNIKIIRQFSVGRKTVDGYDKENNIVYEIDEDYHKYKNKKLKDEARDTFIKQKLECEIIRIDERQFFKNKELVI